MSDWRRLIDSSQPVMTVTACNCSPLWYLARQLLDSQVLGGWSCYMEHFASGHLYCIWCICLKNWLIVHY